LGVRIPPPLPELRPEREQSRKAGRYGDSSRTERDCNHAEVLARADQGFYRDVRTEMKKVTSPSLKEVRATTTVVIITVFLFAFYFWLVDLAISNSLERMLHYLSRH
jgi:preprotein translocase subunit SecE